MQTTCLPWGYNMSQELELAVVLLHTQGMESPSLKLPTFVPATCEPLARAA